VDSNGNVRKPALDRRAPLHRHEAEAVAVLGDMARRREGRMVERDLRPFGRSHVEHAAAGGPRDIGIHVEHGRPVRVAHEQGRVIGRIRQDQQLARAGGEHIRRVPWSMARRGDRGEPRHDLLVHLILLHILGDGAEDAAGAEEAASHVLGSLVHAGVVHPERPFGGRNQHFGVGEYILIMRRCSR